ncbi:MAG: hypothetical protein KY459_11900 [Acidobacteria bacterium]|nr:hypothetical protein [Acidobacteriota bacterium]
MSGNAPFRLPPGSKISCETGDQRNQVVHVEREEDHLRIWSVVVPPRVAREIDDLDLRLWEANRFRELIGFTVDRRGRIIGEAFVPAAGLTEDEWSVYVETLATSCDRLEYVLTGRDVY